jgi:hypothetical protein
MKTVSLTYAPGQTIYAYPDASDDFSLAAWTTHRILLTEGTGVNTGHYSGSLDESKSELWRYFIGASQPTDWSQSKGYFGLSDAAIDGDYLLTATITDAETTDPIESAKITLSRTGSRTAGLTDGDGVVILGVDAATWTYVVRAAGYEIKTGSIVVSDDTTLDVEMDSIVQVTPEPGTISAYYLLLDEDGTPKPSVSVVLKAKESLNAVDGIAVDSTSRTVVSDANGIVTFNNLVPGFTYIISMGSTRQYTIHVPANAQDQLPLRSIVI